MERRRVELQDGVATLLKEVRRASLMTHSLSREWDGLRGNLTDIKGSVSREGNHMNQGSGAASCYVLEVGDTGEVIQITVA